MRSSTIFGSIGILIAALAATACEGYVASSNEKVIKSTKAGDVTITLSSANGEIKTGENDLTLSFSDPAGNSVEVPAASLKFHMPAMGAMAEMNDIANLTTSDKPGKLRGQVNIEVPGSWEAMISFQGKRGTEQATMSVTAK